MRNKSRKLLSCMVAWQDRIFLIASTAVWFPGSTTAVHTSYPQKMTPESEQGFSAEVSLRLASQSDPACCHQSDRNSMLRTHDIYSTHLANTNTRKSHSDGWIQLAQCAPAAL